MMDWFKIVVLAMIKFWLLDYPKWLGLRGKRL